MPQTFSEGKKIYSVDMMFSYINLFHPKHSLVDVKELIHQLSFKGWGDRKVSYSPNDVLQNPSKYRDEMKRIKKADLKYPIIVSNDNIIDGVHRLCKAILEKKQTIKAYVFEKDLMIKFLIRKDGDWQKCDQMGIHEIIELFVKNF